MRLHCLRLLAREAFWWGYAESECGCGKSLTAMLVLVGASFGAVCVHSSPFM